MILVEHGTIITVDAGRRILTDGSVLIDGAEIVQVGPARDVRPPRVPDRVIDARRMVVTPGFVDTHVHLSEHLNRGLLLDDIPVDRYLPDWLIPLYSVMTAEDEEHAALLAGIEMIRTGTTTFCEAGTLFEPAAVAAAMERLGMRAILGRWTWDLEAGPDRMRQSTREALRANEMMLEEVNGRAGLVSAWPLLLGFGTCSEELIRGAKALADRHRIGWGMMHLASHPSRKTRDRLPLATLDGWGVLGPNAKLSHMVYLDDADIARLARRGVKISHCPTAGLKHTKGLAAHARVPEMIARGVCVSLGGDSGNGSNHFDMLRMMYLVATIYKDAPRRERDAARDGAGDGDDPRRGIAPDGAPDRLARARKARRPGPLRPRSAGVAPAAQPAQQPGLRGDRIERAERDDRRPSGARRRPHHHGGRAGDLRAGGGAGAGAGAARGAHHREQVADYRMKPRNPLRASASRAASACSREA